MITMVLFIWLLTLLIEDFPPTIHKGTLRIHLEGSPRCTQGASVRPGYMFLASSPDTCHPSFNSPGCPFFVCSLLLPPGQGQGKLHRGSRLQGRDQRAPGIQRPDSRRCSDFHYPPTSSSGWCSARTLS